MQTRVVRGDLGSSPRVVSLSTIATLHYRMLLLLQGRESWMEYTRVSGRGMARDGDDARAHTIPTHGVKEWPPGQAEERACVVVAPVSRDAQSLQQSTKTRYRDSTTPLTIKANHHPPTSGRELTQPQAPRFNERPPHVPAVGSNTTSSFGKGTAKNTAQQSREAHVQLLCRRASLPSGSGVWSTKGCCRR